MGRLLRLGAGRRGWSPLSLSPAAWYDPSDLSTLWKDTAGTTPVTADGDAVARIDDKSGNGRHLLQATSGKRPLYKTSGGLSWLQFDGSDDHLVTASSPALDLGTIEIYSLLQQTAESITHQGYCVLASTTNPDWGGVDALAFHSNNTSIYSCLETAGGAASYIGSGNAPLALYEMTKAGTSATVRKNGDTGTSGTITGLTTQTGNMFVGARAQTANTAGNGYFAGNYYGLAIFSATLSAGNRALLRTWLGNKAGLSI